MATPEADTTPEETRSGARRAARPRPGPRSSGVLESCSRPASSPLCWSPPLSCSCLGVAMTPISRAGPAPPPLWPRPRFQRIWSGSRSATRRSGAGPRPRRRSAAGSGTWAAAESRRPARRRRSTTRPPTGGRQPGPTAPPAPFHAVISKGGVVVIGGFVPGDELTSEQWDRVSFS